MFGLSLYTVNKNSNKGFSKHDLKKNLMICFQTSGLIDLPSVGSVGSSSSCMTGAVVSVSVVSFVPVVSLVPVASAPDQ